MVTLIHKPLYIKMKYISKFTSILAILGIFSHSLHAEDLSAQAAEALEAGDAKTAVSLYEDAIKADSENATLQTDYANALAVRINEVNFMTQGMIAGKMLKAYRRSVELDPNHVVGWIGLCRYYINAPAIAGGSADKAEEFAQEVMKLLPQQGHVEMGLVAEKRGEKDSAIEHFEKALALNPEHGEAKYHLERLTKAEEA